MPGSLLGVGFTLLRGFGAGFTEVALAAKRSFPVDEDLCHLVAALVANHDARYVFRHREILSTRFSRLP